MPSPFPGMDPFLEAPEFWHDVHVQLIAALARVLNRELPEGLAAHIEQWVCVTQPDFLAMAPEPKRIDIPTLEVRLPYIEIVTARGKRDVVTAIEVLSPVNKRGQGREQYIGKQQDILRSRTHLLEIDLLRGGRHTVAVPEAYLRAETDWDYLICLHRAEDSGFFCWDIRVRDPLPTMRIPLTADHPDLLVDLQALFTQVYDDGPFRREVNYLAEPTPRLKSVDARWADGLLRERKLR